jgi:hypothetical protein
MTDATKTNDILVSTYGNKAPDAAKFGVGVSDQKRVQEAQDARRNAKPGEYAHKRP